MEKRQEDVIKIDVVVFLDQSGDWFAQGIQHDIAAHARSPSTLRHAFEKKVLANIIVNRKIGRLGLEGIPPAPIHFKNMFDEAGEELNPVSRDAAHATTVDARLRLLEAA